MALHLVPCQRPAMPAWSDSFGNTIGEDRPVANFEAAFAPPTARIGNQIVDGVLRETTVTKPTLLEVTGDPDVKSGDPIIVDGEAGWEVDGDPAAYLNPFNGHAWPLVIELRRSVG